MAHGLFLTTRQRTKIANALANKMSTSKKLSQGQLFKIIQSGGYLGEF